jgi:2-phospho-L-lactate guanylyltransferase
MRIALIPVKELSQAKARLASMLSEQARRDLALGMACDVIDAALACAAIDEVAVVTRDLRVLTVATDAGVEGMVEQGGLNEALDAAAEKAAAKGADRIIVLVSDLPLVTPKDLATVAEVETQVGIVLSQDGGTNAFVLPPGKIAFRFGPDSARQHFMASNKQALRSKRIDAPSIAFDVDTPDDLGRLLELARTTEKVGKHTMTALEMGGLIRRAVRD